MIIISLLIGSGTSWATLLTDNFDRGDTAYSTNISYIGAGWVSSLAADRAAIKSNALMFDVPATLNANHLIYNTSLAMTAGEAGGDSWTYSADVKIDGSGVYGGIAFNIQDANNFYALRIKAGDSLYQMIRVADGVVSAFVNKSDLTSSIVAGGTYTFTVSSDIANQFTFSITEAGSSTALNPQTFTSQGSGNYDGGYAGFYHWTGLGSRLPDATYDNFSLDAPTPASTPWTDTLTDDFNRGDTAYSTDISYIGAGWVSSLAADRAAIKSNTLAFDVPATLSANHLLYNTGIVLNAGAAGDEEWEYSVDVKIDGSGVYGGIAFNIQDANNFYALRIKVGTTDYQMIRVLNGSLSAFVNKSDLTSSIVAGGTYTFTVSSDIANQFAFTITEAGSSTVLNPQTFTSQGNGSFDGGYAGFYHWTGLGSRLPDATYDNFSVGVVSSNETDTTSYSAWIAQYPTLGSSTNYTDDPDFDNMDNLLEYALGGVPTSSDAASILPVFGMMEDGGTNWMYYTYNRRIDADDRQLSYVVVSGTELVSDAMTNVVETLAPSPIDAEFESVTNRVSTEVEAQSFMTLKVGISE